VIEGLQKFVAGDSVNPRPSNEEARAVEPSKADSMKQTSR
jgi:hypothetical protein